MGCRKTISLATLMFAVIISVVSCNDSNAGKYYMSCLQTKCQSQLNNSDAKNFMNCASKHNNQCIIGQFFSNNSFENKKIDQNRESQCVKDCENVSVNLGANSIFINSLVSCTNKCLIETQKQINEENEENKFDINLPIFIIIFGTVFIIILFYTIYVCIKRNRQPLKCEWQIQQEINARNQAERQNLPIQENIVFPTPLPYVPDNDFYKSCTNPSQLRSKTIDESLANTLYEHAQKKLYGDIIGIPGVLQYGIPFFAFPYQPETQELKILEAEIITPQEQQNNKSEVVIDIQAIQTQQVQIIKSNEDNKQDNTVENNNNCILNMDIIYETENDENNEIQNELPIQSLKIRSISIQNNEQQTQQNTRKCSADFSRSNKIFKGVQQNMKRLSCA